MRYAIIVCLLACGCATPKNAEYYKGYKDCAGKVSGVFDYIDILEKEQDHCFKKSYYEDQIKDLQMQNMALKAGNEYLSTLVSRYREDCLRSVK